MEEMFKLQSPLMIFERGRKIERFRLLEVNLFLATKEVSLRLIISAMIMELDDMSDTKSLYHGDHKIAKPFRYR